MKDARLLPVVLAAVLALAVSLRTVQPGDQPMALLPQDAQWLPMPDQ